MHRYPPPSPPFALAERGAIWDGLENLANHGRLKVIRQVSAELRHGYPEGYQKIAAMPHTDLPIRKTQAVIVEYQRIVTAYPDIRPGPGKDPADPWLVLIAKKREYTILSEELKINERDPSAKGKRKT